MSPELRPNVELQYILVSPPKASYFLGGARRSLAEPQVHVVDVDDAARRRSNCLFCALPYVIVEDAQFSFVHLFTENRLMVSFSLLNFVLYPFSREIYFRLTQPIRVAIGGIIVWGWVVFLLWFVRLAIFAYIWLLAIPVGLVGLVYLATQEAWGKGWRIRARPVAVTPGAGAPCCPRGRGTRSRARRTADRSAPGSPRRRAAECARSRRRRRRMPAGSTRSCPSPSSR